MSGTFYPPLTSKETTRLRSRHVSRLVRHASAVMHVGIANPRWRGKRSIMGIENYVSEIAFISLGPNELTELVDFPIMPWKPPLFQFCIAPANRSTTVIISHKVFHGWELSLKRIVLSFSTKWTTPRREQGAEVSWNVWELVNWNNFYPLWQWGRFVKKEKSGQYEKCVV